MKLELKTRDDFMAVWNALQQFVDNSDQSEWSDDEPDTELASQRKAAQALLAQCDAAIAATA